MEWRETVSVEDYMNVLPPNDSMYKNVGCSFASAGPRYTDSSSFSLPRVR